MDSQLIKVGAAVVVALGITWGGTTWYGGQQIAAQYPKALAKLNDGALGPLKIVINKQQFGFFTGRVDWDVIFTPNPCEPDHTIKFSGYDDIKNGVFPSLGWGEIQSHIIWPEEARPILTKIFGTKEPLQIKTNVGFLGGLQVQVMSPASTFGNEKGSFEWKGFTGKITQDRTASRLHGNLISPGISFTSADKETVITLDKVSYDFDSQKGQSGLGLGQGELVFSALNAVNAGKSFGFKDFKLISETTEKDGFFAMSMTYKVAELLQEGKSIGKIELAVTADHIDALALKDVVAVMQKMQTQCKPAPDRLLKAAQPIFAKGISAKVNHLDIGFFDGKAHAEATANLPALTVEEQKDPKSAVQKFSVDGKANVTQALLIKLADIAGKTQGQPTSPEQSAQMVEMMLAKPVSEGLLSKSADGYTTTLQVCEGKVSVNGTPLN
ncbi:YdgA family protein [Aquirhabdus parva]|uniref:DUF945 domain-containing protein n=1 Tax=Aquirhabdus parva TaxID=2283318 RepID=A0A345P4H5_9GAMM|nr:YdgA family protein [Aquirhabdus parva]AXI02184.1 DUF945 domain-containing protein [Aquirhabdus parva]